MGTYSATFIDHNDERFSGIFETEELADKWAVSLANNVFTQEVRDISHLRELECENDENKWVAYDVDCFHATVNLLTHDSDGRPKEDVLSPEKQLLKRIMYAIPSRDFDGWADVGQADTIDALMHEVANLLGEPRPNDGE